MNYVAVSVGSNIEPIDAKIKNIELSLVLLQRNLGKFIATSGLFESSTAYVKNPTAPTVQNQGIYIPKNKVSSDYKECPSHLNAVFIFSVETLSPEEVLEKLLKTEMEMGRQRPESRDEALRKEFGSFKEDSKTFHPYRPIDIDLLLYADIVYSSPRLTVPHSRLKERNFILYPLNDAMTNTYIANITNWVSYFNFDASVWIRHNLSQEINELNEALYCVPYRVCPITPSNLWAYGSNIIPKVMGVLNVTDNSFSDGNEFLLLENAMEQVEKMINEGADIIDVGGESAAPFRDPVSEEVELSRVIPTIKAIRKRWPEIIISSDTTKSKVLREAIMAGANILNDISGGTYDPDMLKTAAELNCCVILGHTKGNTHTMISLSEYDSVSDEIIDFLKARTIEAERCGIPRWRIVLDVGIGFAKNGDHNMTLLRNLNFVGSQLPYGTSSCISISRKRFLRKIVSDADRSMAQKCSVDPMSNKLRYDLDLVSANLIQCVCQAQMKEKQISDPNKSGNCLSIIRTHNVRLTQLSLNTLKLYFL